MNRRESIRAIAISSISAGAILSACKHSGNNKGSENIAGGPEPYGRTQAEIEHDAKLMNEKFFTDAEMSVLTILCNMIIPTDERSGNASDAKVPEFVEFTMKDQPKMQVPMRGGLKWLDVKSMRLFNKSFGEASEQQRLELVNLIAYPEKAKMENMPGVNFFNTLRNLTATGFFTSKIGMADLEYMGNQPNQWNGVPDDVLKQYDLAYDEKILRQCLGSDDMGKMMVWEN